MLLDFNAVMNCLKFFIYLFFLDISRLESCHLLLDCVTGIYFLLQ